MADSKQDTGTPGRPKNDLSVSIAQEPVPKLPHEHDESVESQVDGPKPAASNSSPSTNPRQKNTG